VATFGFTHPFFGAPDSGKIFDINRYSQHGTRGKKTALCADSQECFQPFDSALAKTTGSGQKTDLEQNAGVN
jgi:hypothetical protein